MPRFSRFHSPLWAPTLSVFCLSALMLSPGCGAEGPVDPQELLGSRQLPIINGEVSASGFMPAVGALVINVPGYYQAFCSGTLIAKRWVLTAAHCLDTEMPAYTPIGFFIGNRVYAGGAAKAIVPAKAKHPHPKYKGGSQAPGGLADYYDIGLVELSRDAPIEPAKMIQPKEVGTTFRTGGDMLIVGFGMTQANDPNSTGTKYDGITKLQFIGKSEIYLETSTGTTTCQGDSGGPNFVNAAASGAPIYKHAGVTSRGAEGCVSGSVQTRTDSYLSWIHGLAKGIPCSSGLSPDCGSEPPPPAKKKKIGETCNNTLACVGDLCALIGGKRVCSRICDTRAPNCPSGYYCGSIDDGGIKGVCAATAPPPPPGKKGMGETCAGHSECASGQCASQGARTFCTATCTLGDNTCKNGLGCNDVGGQSLCTPAPASSGGCAVTPSAAEPWGGLLGTLALLALAFWVRRRR